MNKIELLKQLEHVILDLMAATTKPPTKKGMAETQEYVLKSYKNLHRIKRELSND